MLQDSNTEVSDRIKYARNIRATKLKDTLRKIKVGRVSAQMLS